MKAKTRLSSAPNGSLWEHFKTNIFLYILLAYFFIIFVSTFDFSL